MRAIVVIEMLVESVEGKFKLNQHKNDADHVAIARGARRQDDPERADDRGADGRVAAAFAVPGRREPARKQRRREGEL